MLAVDRREVPGVPEIHLRGLSPQAVPPRPEADRTQAVPPAVDQAAVAEVPGVLEVPEIRLKVTRPQAVPV